MEDPMKKRILCLLALLLLTSSLWSCQKQTAVKDDQNKNENNESLTGDPELDAIIKKAQEEGPVLPEGMTEVWFDEVFRAFYPKQLADVYPTQVYVYGDYETEQPVMCFSSEELSNVELFRIEDGKAGETLYTVEKLLPMEAIVLQIRAEATPDIGVRFTDANGTEYSYGIAHNEDDSEIVLSEFPLS